MLSQLLQISDRVWERTAGQSRGLVRAAYKPGAGRGEPFACTNLLSSFYIWGNWCQEEKRFLLKVVIYSKSILRLGLVSLSEKAMAPHSSTFAWKIPWTEEPGRQQFMGSLESDTTEQLHFHFSLSCMGEGNGNPLQCSCLENPRDGEAWWAAVYGVAQSWTRLKRLSSSSSLSVGRIFFYNPVVIVSDWQPCVKSGDPGFKSKLCHWIVVMRR